LRGVLAVETLDIGIFALFFIFPAATSSLVNAVSLSSVNKFFLLLLGSSIVSASSLDTILCSVMKKNSE
jgi:hypothetical protein